VPGPDPQAGEHPAAVAARTEGGKTGGGSGTNNHGRHGFCLLGLAGSRNWVGGERGERREERERDECEWVPDCQETRNFIGGWVAREKIYLHSRCKYTLLQLITSTTA
jgi:hypothetical protein